jgi:hypothetical protein
MGEHRYFGSWMEEEEEKREEGGVVNVVHNVLQRLKTGDRYRFNGYSGIVR